MSLNEIVAIETMTREAGLLALRSFRLGSVTTSEVFTKEGNSPVTAADFAVDRYLNEACAHSLPDCAWFSEETADTAHRLDATRLIIADPIDGTRAFVSGHPQWCVSVALVDADGPLIGCIFAPALDELFIASRRGGATLNGRPLEIPSDGHEALTAFGPKPMIDWLNARLGLDLRQKTRIPSLAYRIAVIAKGDASLGLAGPDSHDWDIAAADIILHEAGGILHDLEGRRPVYNQVNPVHPALLAAGPMLSRVIVDGMQAPISAS